MNRVKRILIVDDDEIIFNSFKLEFEKRKDLKEKYKLYYSNNARSAYTFMGLHDYEIVFLDIHFPNNESGIDILNKVRGRDPFVTVYMLTNDKNIDKIFASSKAGADGYIIKPFDFREIEMILDKSEENGKNQKRESILLKRNMENEDFDYLINSTNEKVKKILSQVKEITKKDDDITILIEGEPGTGKTKLANYINYKTKANGFERHKVNIALMAINPNMFESELFGHTVGAYTGAEQDKIGLIEMANGGDLLLENIADLRLDLQAKLLRVLQEKQYYKAGDTVPRYINFRLICETNKDLKKEVDEGRFREDLYYRLNVINFIIPPLRERRDDIPYIANSLFGKIKKNEGNKLQDKIIEKMLLYNWPGNIKELENTILNYASTGNLNIDKNISINDIVKNYSKSEAEGLEEIIHEIRRNIIENCITQNEGSIKDTLKELKISQASMYRYRIPYNAKES